jgi:hypothetical protein
LEGECVESGARENQIIDPIRTPKTHTDILSARNLAMIPAIPSSACLQPNLVGFGHSRHLLSCLGLEESSHGGRENNTLWPRCSRPEAGLGWSRTETSKRSDDSTITYLTKSNPECGKEAFGGFVDCAGPGVPPTTLSLDGNRV